MSAYRRCLLESVYRGSISQDPPPPKFAYPSSHCSRHLDATYDLLIRGYLVLVCLCVAHQRIHRLRPEEMDRPLILVPVLSRLEGKKPLLALTAFFSR
jgi:hypothetical protein